MASANRLAIGLLAALLGAPLAAHDTWLLAGPAAVSAGERVRLEITSGMAFPAPDTAPDPERFERLWAVGVDRSVTQAASWRRLEKGTAWEGPVAGPTTAVVAITTRPRTLDLTDEDVAHYLDEIAAPRSVREAWARAPAPRKWVETYVKNAKVWIGVRGAAADMNPALGAIGQPLEFEAVGEALPQRAGDTLALRLLYQGRPLAEQPVGLVFEGESTAKLLATDARGEVRFTLERPGRYLIRTTYLRPPAAPGEAWTSDFATATLAVAAAGGKR